MLELKQTERFRKWRATLKDERARALIASRLDRLAYGHEGDVSPVGDGVGELRVTMVLATASISAGKATRW